MGDEVFEFKTEEMIVRAFLDLHFAIAMLLKDVMCMRKKIDVPLLDRTIHSYQNIQTKCNFC